MFDCATDFTCHIIWRPSFPPFVCIFMFVHLSLPSFPHGSLSTTAETRFVMLPPSPLPPPPSLARCQFFEGETNLWSEDVCPRRRRARQSVRQSKRGDRRRPPSGVATSLPTVVMQILGWMSTSSSNAYGRCSLRVYAFATCRAMPPPASSLPKYGLDRDDRRHDICWSRSVGWDVGRAT